VRRFHEGAHNQREAGAEREVGHHRVQHHGITRLRNPFGLLGIHALGWAIGIILTRRNRLANTFYLS
jgi:hypothetical protein